jgi:hypothetical protein
MTTRINFQNDSASLRLYDYENLQKCPKTADVILQFQEWESPLCSTRGWALPPEHSKPGELASKSLKS